MSSLTVSFDGPRTEAKPFVRDEDEEVVDAC